MGGYSFTFALGTSGGDLVSERLKLGYALAAGIFITAIAIIYLAYKFMGMSSVLAFWLAYILTRPLGASLGDLLTQSPKDAGLGIGTAVINAIFFIIIIVLVIYLTMQQKRKDNSVVRSS